MKKILVSPSILSADFRTLEREVKAAQDAGADLIHCDVMDGHFVPNLTFGPFIVEAVKKCVSIPLDVHLMIYNPEKYIGAFCDAGADILAFHAEAVTSGANKFPSADGRLTQGGEDAVTVRSLLNDIRARGVRSGIAVNPNIPIDLFMDDLDVVDQAVVMSVYAGFGGQKFIPDVMEKVRAIRKASDARGLDIDIEVDGGVNGETAAVCAAAGANVLVAGSYVFNSDDYAGRIKSVRDGAAKGMK